MTIQARWFGAWVGRRRGPLGRILATCVLANVLFLAGWPARVSAQSSGPRYAGAVGTNNFGNSSNAVGSEESSCTNGGGSTNLVGFWNTYGFTLPAGATITGIQVEVKASWKSDPPSNQQINIGKNESTLGTAKSFPVTEQDCGSGQTVRTYGGSSDTWGLSWTVADINSNNFTVRINKGTADSELFINWIRVTVYYTTAETTTLGSGTDPANASLAPGGAATSAGAFTFQTTGGTDAITAVTVTLATGTSGGLSLVEITDDAGSTVYGSVTNPASDTPTITLTTNITATTTATQYKIRVTPKSHAAMPAPVGSSYAVTARISAWTGSNTTAGSDAAGTTVTIDNLSPGNVTSSTATAGNAQVALAWTNPGDADLASIVVLRRAASAVADVPAEGVTYTVGNTIGTSTVACVVTAPTASCTDTGLSNGTAYHYKIFAKDANGNYATGVVPSGSPATPNLTTLGNGTDPANASLAPGGAATTADAFTFQTATGTDNITAVTVILSAGSAGGLSLVQIQSNGGGTTYGSVSNPTSDTLVINLSTNITATTTSTSFRIRVTPKSHAAMPAPPGSTYSVTARISDWTGTNAKAGSDAAGTTVTIDNLSPGNVTSSTATAGNGQVALAWTNPGDADLGSIVVLRRASSAVADVPAEGVTYTVGTTIGASTVACVVTAPTASCTDTGLSNGTAYHYKIFAKDANGNYGTGVVPTGSPATPNLTTLGNGTDPANASRAPGAAATMADAFTFQAASGTDAITAVTVTLATGASGGLSLVEITNDAGTILYGSVANPASDTPAITLTTNITATTTATQYKIRVTPKSHAAMPAPVGSSYAVTARISAWTGSNTQAGSDAAGTTVTIDNLSPGNVTSSTATPGNAQVSLSWTNPGDTDLGTIVVLRRASSAVADVPAEGATYTVGTTIGSSTVACVVTAPAASCTDTGLSNGTAYHYKIFAKDANGNYATGVVPTGSPATPNLTIITSVSPDGGANLKQLPSNGVNYSFSFDVANGGNGADAFGLKAFGRPGGAVTILSVNGIAGDSANATIGAGSTLVVPVVYSIGNVAGGVVDSIYLRARSTTIPAASDTGFADLTVVRPNLTISKAVVAAGGPVPGTELTYLLSFTDAGTSAATGVVLVDSLPAEVDFKIGSEGSTLPPGVTVALSYSNNAGVTWTYTPVSAGCGAPAGYDRCLNRVRWTFTGAISATPPNNGASMQFIARIR